MTTIPTTTRRASSLGATLAVIAVAAVVGCQRPAELGPVANASASKTIREAFAQGGGEEGGDSAAVATGTGWATLKGRFVYDGVPPQMPPYNVNKDQAVCTINGTAPLQQTLLVDDATKGIANVVIFARSASRVHESAASPSSESAKFDQKHCVFLSHVFPLTLGQQMVIMNSDPIGHNTKIDGKNSLNQTIEAGKSIDFTPQKEEAIPVRVQCSIHPWMLAYMLPRKNGYYAVTATDGTFEIANLPAGEELEFQVWHENATGTGHALVLTTPEVKELRWSKKGRFKLKLGEDEVKELDVTIPAAALGG